MHGSALHCCQISTRRNRSRRIVGWLLCSQDPLAAVIVENGRELLSVSRPRYVSPVSCVLSRQPCSLAVDPVNSVVEASCFSSLPELLVLSLVFVVVYFHVLAVLSCVQRIFLSPTDCPLILVV